MSTETKSTQAEILLADITTSSTNEMFRDPFDFTKDALAELIESIKAQGLIQPILLRPDKTKGKYILVAGERRFHASKFLDTKKIPAYIREMTDEDAFDLQLTENIQRKDVHPMREGRAYKLLHDEKKWTTGEIALRFGKSETYILQRLKLCSLIKKAEAAFVKGEITLAHAILLARLTAEDQEETLSDCSDGTYNGKTIYRTASDMEEFIKDNIIRDLKEAPFDTKDPNLVPKAGSCLTCPKRSGASLLFADVKEKDRCFDGACFGAKKNIGVFAKIKATIEEKPDTIFLEAYAYHNEDKTPQQIGSLLASQKIKVLGHSSWQKSSSSWDNMTKKISGMVVNGDQAGKIITAYVKSTSKLQATSSTPVKPADLGAADKKEAIARIKERNKRNVELDHEKVYARVMRLMTDETAVDESPNDSGKVYKAKEIKAPTGKATAAELAMIRYQIVRKADEAYDKIQDKFGYDTGVENARKEADLFWRMSDEDMIKAVREIARQHEWCGQATHVTDVEGQLWLDIARSWGVPVAQFEKEQAEIRTKREERAAARIAELSKSPVKAKKSTPIEDLPHTKVKAKK